VSPNVLRRGLGAAAAALVAALGLVDGASGSQLVDRNAQNVRIAVNAKGEALLTYDKAGRKVRVLAWGAVNAKPPTPSAPQVELQLDYAGGWGKYRQTGYGKGFKNTCRPYSGPVLAWLVAACTAPDGSHWALQAWQRALPNYGVEPTPEQAVWELRLSHWTGDIAQLAIYPNWAYRRFDHIFGSFTYNGLPVHGFRSTSTGNPLDSYGRNVYVDTFESRYGSGWKRENSFLTHKGSGRFCYGFYPHGAHPSGMGQRYRATIIGPGVTPDVMAEWTPLGRYDKARDLELHAQQKAFLAGDKLCKAV
jgi:hypothetical protein